ncbi:MAG TPA: hypothetical protein VG711_04180 [Phycisphaerales bacterium]|nr:hypothetical protein [Phycisphaerales bacterium]
MKYAVQTILMVFCCIGVVLGQEPSGHQTVHVIATQPVQADKRMDNRFPASINPTDLLTYSRLLSLSEEQSAYLNFLYEQYAEQWNDLLDREWGQLDGLNAWTAEKMQGHPIDWEAAQRYENFIMREQAVENSELLLESTLFKRLGDVLTTEQSSWMWRVTSHRERERCDVIPMGWPAARIDLSALIDEVIRPDDEARSKFDGILIDYEHEVTDYFVEVDHVITHRLVKSTWMAAKWHYEADGSQIDTHKPNYLFEIQASFDELKSNELREEGDLQKKIVECNKKTLKRLRDLLTPTEFDSLDKAFRLRAWPEVYIDSYDPELFYSRICRDTSLTPQQRSDIDAAWQLSHQRYDEVSLKMSEESDKSAETFVRTLGFPDFPSYKKKMRDYRDDRWKIDDHFADQVLTVLLEEQSSLRRNVSEYKKWIKQGREAGKNDSYPW